MKSGNAKTWRGPGITEMQLQRAVIGHLEMLGKRGLVCWHTPNGGNRSRTEAAIFSGLGVKAGVPDLCIVLEGRFYGLELKTETGRLSAAQIEMHDKLRRAGAEVATACGLSEALATLERWGLLRTSPGGAPARLGPMAQAEAAA